MPKKITNDEYINRSRKIHGDKYDYIGKYLGMKTKVNMKCNICGLIFSQTPAAHIHLENGCPGCAGNLKCDTLTFKKKAVSLNQDKFDYTFVDFNGYHNKILVICNDCCNIFSQTPDSHLHGYGCSICAGNQKKTEEKFIEESLKKYGDDFDYTSVNFVNTRTKVDIICNKCKKTFSRLPSNHTSPTKMNGCPHCAGLFKINAETFFSTAYKIYGDKYEYPDKFEGMGTKINIKCNNCGKLFPRVPANFIHGKNGCPHCAKYGFNPDKPAIKYYFKDITNGLYKIGITNRTVEKRFGSELMKIIEIIDIQHFEVGGDAFDREQAQHKQFKEFQKDNENFRGNGATEFFEGDILNLDNKEILN